MAQTTETPAETLEKATEENIMPLKGMALLGTTLRPEKSTALVRAGNGRIRQVSSGDRLGQSLVVAIEQGVLHLSHGGRTHRLRLPDG